MLACCFVYPDLGIEIFKKEGATIKGGFEIVGVRHLGPTIQGLFMSFRRLLIFAEKCPLRFSEFCSFSEDKLHQ